MFSESILLLWSGAGLVWWIIAWCLVRRDRGAQVNIPVTTSRPSLSVFKPFPPLSERGLATIEGGIESFVAQLDPGSELLLGIHEADRASTAPFLARLRADYPQARLKIVFRAAPDESANPKIAWQRRLAPEAEGELWLWSDADIIAPPNFLVSACETFAKSGARMVTFPYVVQWIPTAPALLEALFVNVEFYPGVLLLRRSGPVNFGFGAAVLFRREDFMREMSWDEIGSRLADDFFLGQKLRPVHIGTTRLTTVPNTATWREAFRHDLRWSKTIRWNRPGGFLARILIMPVAGWMVFTAFCPTHFFAWAGLMGMIQADVLAAVAISRQAGCLLGWRDLPRLELWSLWRIALWFFSWMPGGVAWSGRTWRRPQMALTEINLTTT